MTETSSRPARCSYRTRPITIAESKIVLMPEEDRAEAVAVLARWLAEVLDNDDFRARHEAWFGRTKKDSE